MYVLKLSLKKIICFFLYVFFMILYKIFPKCNNLPSKTKAEHIIKNSGYQIPLTQLTHTQLRINSIDLSIIVPVYNSEIYISKCIESLLNQETKYNYEIICVIDGCTDRSEDIINKYKSLYNDKILICKQENLGISAARNKGLELANGEYVGFVDNDDYVNENYVENILDGIKKNDADMIQVGYMYVDVKGNIISKHHIALPLVIDNNKSLDYINQISGFIWAGAYRKSIFEKVRFNPGFWYEDMITKCVLARQCHRVVILPECMYYYTMHENNASKKLWNTASVKSLDSVFLPIYLFTFAKDVLHLEQDDVINGLTIHELCWQFPNRAIGLPHEVKKAAFSIIKDFIIRNNIFSNSDKLHWKTFCKLVKNDFYYNWLFLAYAEKWKSKIC